MSHAVVIGVMFAGLAVALHICMTLLLIAPFDNYTKKNAWSEDAGKRDVSFNVKGKARQSHTDNAPKNRADYAEGLGLAQ